MVAQYCPTIQHLTCSMIGLFFVFSGVMKLRAPVDFSWKIATYLRSFAQDIHTMFLRLMPYTFHIAIAVCVIEIALGVMLVCSCYTLFVLAALLGLTVFFMFLTGYTIWRTEMDSCGCLSDAIPLTPVQSFIKNIVLLVLLIWLIWTYSSLP